MAETRISEPKLDGDTKVRKVRRDRKDYGEIRYYPGPTKTAIYWTRRRTDQFHRQQASWMVDADTVQAIKLYGVTHVGLLIEDGTKLLTPIATFGAAGQGAGAQLMRSNTYVDPRGHRGAMCWHIPLPLWAQALAPQEVRQEHILAQMHLKRSRIKST